VGVEMNHGWQRRRILIWGKTRPELSKRYKEVVCTGGVFEDTRSLVRLYPIPLRFMGSDRYFKKYQWVDVDVLRPTDDPRPESYRVRHDTIMPSGSISTKGDWSERARWILNDGNIVQSVEELHELQKKNHTSLRLMKPKTITNVSFEPFPTSEKTSYWERHNRITSELEFAFDEEKGTVTKPLRPPDFRFKVQFRCDDPRCRKDHEFSVLDWEVDALYFNLHFNKNNSPRTAATKVKDKLLESLDMATNDVYLFLGNISSHPQIFTIVGLWHPKKKTPRAQSDQGELF
jgi:hypothetical protein